MSKKFAIALAVALLLIAAWALGVGSDSFSIVVNGQPVHGLLKGAIGVSGLLAALITGFCVAILLLFVFAGIGIFVLGGVVFVGMILTWVEFPFIWPLLVPLALLWLFVAIARRAGASK